MFFWEAGLKLKPGYALSLLFFNLTYLAFLQDWRTQPILNSSLLYHWPISESTIWI